MLENIERAISTANAKGIPAIHIQHVAKQGMAPYFNEGAPGAEIHPRILASVPDAPIIVKEFGDSFEKTNLEETLKKLGVTELLLCGMMTQNCVTHTAISKAAEKYDVTILHDRQRDSAWRSALKRGSPAQLMKGYTPFSDSPDSLPN